MLQIENYLLLFFVSLNFTSNKFVINKMEINMKSKNSDKVLSIYKDCSLPLYKILEGITDSVLNYKPEKDSRSIGEMMLHLMRVDVWMLKRYGFELKTKIPKTVGNNLILDTLKSIHMEIEKIIKECNDEEFNKPALIESPKPTDTLINGILHIAQHYLYHLSQMIYLRRAKERNWISPIDDWDKATHTISGFIIDNN